MTQAAIRTIEQVPTNLDPITIEIIRNRLDAIANSMQHTLLRSAVAVIVKEGEDGSSGLFKIDGDTISQACSCPIHLTAMRPAVRAVIEAYPLDTMQPGDSYILNDPYNGGSHLPDIIMVAPIFYEDGIVAFSAVLAHQEDIGGQEPGSMSANTSELYQEGLIIPPIPWMRAGKPVKASHDIVRYNVRLPKVVLGDLEAQYSACRIGVRGYQEMAASIGIDTINASMDYLFHQAEMRMRSKIAEMPDGVYPFEDWVDSHKPSRDRIKVKCTVTIDGDHVTVDYSGSAPQQDGPINVNLAGAESGAHATMKGLTDPDMPLNEGAVRPITVVAEEGSLYNPQRPAAIALRGQISQRAYDAVLGALVPAIGDKAVACPSGGNMVTSFGGVDEDGHPFGSTDLTTGGIGARPDSDGIDHIEHGFTNVQTPPVEAWEAGYPLRVVQHELRLDSGGAGRYRGGLGVVRAFEVLRGPIRLCHRHDRSRSQAWGIYGGKAGAAWGSYIIRADGTRENLHSKQVFELQTGDVFYRFTGGGGGYGDPLERDPQRVLADVLDRKVSAESAREDYGVVLSADRLALEENATAALRAELAAERGPITWTYDRGGDGIE